MQVIIDVPADKEAAVLAVLAGGTAPAAAAKPTAKPKPAPEPVEEDLLGGTSSGATMADAVELATKFVSEGNSAAVKEALTAVGAGRVSELTDDNIQAFVDSLNG